MRKKLFTNESFRGFITLVCMLLSASVAFAQKIVHVEEAGTLKDKLTEERRVNQQVQNYKRCLKNSHFGVEKFNFSLGLSFNFFCMDIILLSV